LQLSKIASQQMTAENQARREAYHAEVHHDRGEEILVADETAFNFNTGMRRNGWASAHGDTRAVDIQPKIYAPSHSVGCALRFSSLLTQQPDKLYKMVRTVFFM
jgi:hypothetical protein